MLRGCQFSTILASKSFSRAGVVQIWPHLGQQILRAREFLGADFPSRRSHKTMEKHSISRTSYPPNPHVSHLCCITSARSHLLDRSSAATFSIVGSQIPKLPLMRFDFGRLGHVKTGSSCFELLPAATVFRTTSQCLNKHHISRPLCHELLGFCTSVLGICCHLVC